MATEFRTEDCADYRMDYRRPYRELEPMEKEIAVVDRALNALMEAGVLPHTRYDGAKFLAYRTAVAERFDLPWTAISPRMQRLLYAINAVAKAPNLIAAGIFCGFTFISNAGAAIGPGACYHAEQLLGVEIDPDRAALAERNVRKLDSSGTARILADDALDVVARSDGPIHLLYLDADGTPETGKGVYLDILEAAYDRIPPGGLVLAHNSENAAGRLARYLAFVRDPARFRASVNVVLDPEGLEVSLR
jgi:predicted O-methyltransferase YrrM